MSRSLSFLSLLFVSFAVAAQPVVSEGPFSDRTGGVDTHSSPEVMGEAASHDMNQDGAPDVVLLRKRETGLLDLMVFLNDGNGQLGSPIATFTGQYASTSPGFAIGDLDADGWPDAVVMNSLAIVLRGLGNGSFAAPQSRSVGGYGYPYLGLVDTGATLDLLIGDWLYRGNGDGTFGPWTEIGVPARGGYPIDLTADDRLDVLHEGITISASVNDGTGSFATVATPGTITWDMRVVDVTNFASDEAVDLLMVSQSAVHVRAGAGDGSFGPETKLTLVPMPPQFGWETSADFDGDGFDDAAFGSTIYLSDGQGGFRSRIKRIVAGLSLWSDMNGDGRADQVVIATTGDEAEVLLTTPPDATVQSSITLSKSEPVVRYGRNVTYTADVGVASGIVPLSGAVRFSVDGKAVALIDVDTDGKAAFSIALPVGTFTVGATYTGDEQLQEASASLTVMVQKAASRVTVNPSPGYEGTRQAGWTVKIYAQRFPLIEPAPGFVGPTGDLAIRDGETALPPPYWSGTLYSRLFTVGDHVITAEYAGDANYEGSSNSYVQTIIKGTPPSALSVAPESIRTGTQATFNMTFPYAVTGTVTFTIDGAAAVTKQIDGKSVQMQTTFDTPGTRTVRAVYSGDANWYGAENEQIVRVASADWTAIPIATASARNGTLHVSWLPVPGADSYTVWRRPSSPYWKPIATVPASATSFTRSEPIYAVALYGVTAHKADGSMTVMSAPDLGNSSVFSAIIPRQTVISDEHVRELRSGLQQMRWFAGTGFSYTNNIGPDAPMRVLDIAELRSMLHQARQMLGLPPVAFTDPTLTPGVTPVRAVHLLELQDAMD